MYPSSNTAVHANDERIQQVTFCSCCFQTLSPLVIFRGSTRIFSRTSHTSFLACPSFVRETPPSSFFFQRQRAHAQGHPRKFSIFSLEAASAGDESNG